MTAQPTRAVSLFAVDTNVAHTEHAHPAEVIRRHMEAARAAGRALSCDLCAQAFALADEAEQVALAGDAVAVGEREHARLIGLTVRALAVQMQALIERGAR